jgi:cellulose synthase/poly-beta-1,6-N-acetylglucosamine synthase-like glycosyltransferase
MEMVFWASTAVVVFTYLGYPITLLFLRQIVRHPVQKRAGEPFVSVLIPAYNEAAWVEAKINNVLHLDYPPDRIEVVVASDGSTDGTGVIAARLADGVRVRVLDYAVNRGKIGVLNASVPQCRGEIVLFSDCSAMLETGAVREIVANFGDPQVGAVCGAYKVAKPDEADIGRQEDLYWKYETWLKEQESQVSSNLGGHGQIYAVRKALYPAPDPSTINDDFVIPLRVLQQGYRVVYEPRAVVHEEAREMSGFKRRVRVMAGNLQQLAEVGGLLSPPQWLPLYFFVGHKVLRLVVPFAMIAALVSNLFLLETPFFQLTALGQGVFYGLAVAGAWGQLRPRILRVPHYFCMINAAIFAALYHAVQGRRRLAWK